MRRLHLPSVRNSKRNARAHVRFRTIGEALGFPSTEVAVRVVKARVLKG